MRRPAGKEFEKFVDESILFREREETQGRLNLSLFIAGMGAISIGLLKWTGNLPVGRPLALAILAAPAVAIVLGLVNYGRAPTHAKIQALLREVEAADPGPQRGDSARKREPQEVANRRRSQEGEADGREGASPRGGPAPKDRRSQEGEADGREGASPRGGPAPKGR